MILCGSAAGLCEVDETAGMDTPSIANDTTSRITPAQCDVCLYACGLPHDLIEGLARQQAGRWNQGQRWVEPEDIRQEAWLSYFSHRKEIDSLLARGDRDKARLKIRDDVWRYCRKEKAHWGRYEVGDEFFYTLKALRGLLPGAFGGDVSSERGMVAEPRKAPAGSKATGEGDTLHIDVRWGLRQMSQRDRELLFKVYSQPKGETTHPEFARAKGALKRLQEVLGGPA